MIKKTCVLLALGFFVGVLPGTFLPRARAQETGEKNKTEKGASDKSAPDKGTLQMNNANLPPEQSRELEKVIKTFYLPNVSSPTDLQDIVNSLRTILELRRIQQVPSHQTIVVRGTAEQVALAEKLINDMDMTKKKTQGQYRLEFKITELDDDKKVNSRTYSLLVEPHEVGKLRIGSKVPIMVNDKDKTYTDVGKQIDCQVRTETEHTVGLHLALEVSNLDPTERSPATGNPVIQAEKIETSSTLELGKPTVITSFYDPATKHNLQIEATATRAKGAE
jgi:hypothetical protein